MHQVFVLIAPAGEEIASAGHKCLQELLGQDAGEERESFASCTGLLWSDPVICNHLIVCCGP